MAQRERPASSWLWWCWEVLGVSCLVLTGVTARAQMQEMSWSRCPSNPILGWVSFWPPVVVLYDCLEVEVMVACYS